MQEKWSHTGIHNTFGKEMILDRNIFPKEIGRYLKETYELRILGDYRINAVNKNDAEDAIDMCNKFINKVKEIFYE